MMATPPSTNSPSISAGSHGGLSLAAVRDRRGVARRGGRPALAAATWRRRAARRGGCPPGSPGLRSCASEEPRRRSLGSAVGRSSARGVGDPAVGSVAPMRVLVLDNYDSFVFNLVQYLGELGAEPVVHRNDAIDVAAAVALEPDGVLVSPGPGRPGGRRHHLRRRAGVRRAGHAGARRVPRPPGDRPRLRGDDRRRHRADARQDVADRPRRRGRLRRPAVAADGDALPLADDRPGDRARRPGGHGDHGRRHDHGRAPPPPRRRGRAVPPRERPHRLRPRPPAELPGPLRTGASVRTSVARSRPMSGRQNAIVSRAAR